MIFGVDQCLIYSLCSMRSQRQCDQPVFLRRSLGKGHKVEYDKYKLGTFVCMKGVPYWLILIVIFDEVHK